MAEPARNLTPGNSGAPCPTPAPGRDWARLPRCATCGNRHHDPVPAAEPAPDTARAPVTSTARVGVGFYWEEFDIGQTFETRGRTVTESDVVTFAGLTGDYNPLHTDAEYAATTRWGGRIVHGMCGLSIATGLFSRLGVIEGTTEAFLSVDTHFHEVIRIGDTLRMTTRVTRKREMPGQTAGLICFEALLYNQHGQLVQRGTWSVLITRSAEAGEAPATG